MCAVVPQRNLRLLQRTLHPPKSVCNSARRTERAAGLFDDGMSVKEMRRRATEQKQQQQQKKAADDAAAAAETPALARARAAKLPIYVNLPCVFTGMAEPVPAKSFGDTIELQFFDPMYMTMWSYARERTACTIAARYKEGAQSRSDVVFVLWPASHSDSTIEGMVLGIYTFSTASVRPFPMVQILAKRPDTEPISDCGEVPDGERIHCLLLGLSNEEQRSSIRAFSDPERLALVQWLAAGGSSRIIDV